MDSSVEAMVSLNMIDTQGGGIKRIFQAQRRRFFPLPDYYLSQPERVMVMVTVRTTAEVLPALLPEWEFAREHYVLTGYGELVVRARADDDNRSVVHKPA